MSAFTFEIVRQGETPVIAHVLTLSNERAIWCQVEALALRIEGNDRAAIRVKNPKGETIIRAGVATALASIEKFSCKACPLKKWLERQGSGRGRSVVELGDDFFPCERRGG